MITKLLQIPDQDLKKLNEFVDELKYKKKTNLSEKVKCSDKKCVLIDQHEQITCYSENLDNIGKTIISCIEKNDMSKTLKNSMFKMSFNTIENASKYHEIVLTEIKKLNLRQSYILPPLILRSNMTGKCMLSTNIYLLMFEYGPIIPVVCHPLTSVDITIINSLYEKISDIKVDSTSILLMVK